MSDLGMRALAMSLRSQGLEDDVYQHNYKTKAATPDDIEFSLASEACLLMPLLQPHEIGRTWESHVESGTEVLLLSFAGCGHLSEPALLVVIRALPQKLKKL